MNLDRVIAVRNSKTVYQDGDTCIKVFTGRVAAADVLREAANQAAARDAGLPVPEVLAAERVPDGWRLPPGSYTAARFPTACAGTRRSGTARFERWRR